jgi:drug/metabolite transporter (DMT)-like permease
MLAAFLTTVLFSISAVCGHRTAKLLGGTEANFWRLCLAAALLAIYAHAFGPGLHSAAWPTFFLSGCIGFGVGDAALFQALPRLGSRLSVMLVLCLSAPIAAVIEWLWIGTRLSASQIGYGLMILAGVAIALSPGKHLNLSSAEVVPGTLFGLVAAFCQAYGAVLSRKAFAISRLAGESLDGVTSAYQRILGGVVVTAILFAVIRWRSADDGVTNGAASITRKEKWRAAWLWVVLNGLAGPALGVSCYQWALKTTPTGIVLPIVAITPLVIIPFARYVEGERATVRSLFGGLIAVGGAAALALVSRPTG